MKSLSTWIACCLLSSPSCYALSSPTWEEIQDTSGLTILNPDLQERRFCKIRLKNGLEAYLISDPGADQSSAMVSVDAGSWADPVEFPGMAHFCEHMLFMGTEKYPNENEFWSVIADERGSTNAFTAPHQTAFMFSSQSQRFLELLDRFGHFFIDPLFDPSGISRELHAVDQEFAKNIEHDGWRQYQILKETGNPNHPNHLFSTGNAETLGHIPQHALKEWYQQHYGANQMHLALYSSLPLDVLRTVVIELFSAVHVSPKTPSPQMPVTSDRQRGHITYIEPIKDCKELTLSWELPFDLANDPAKSPDLIAYALQKSNLEELLKKKEWIHALSAGIEDLGGAKNRLFQLSLDLTSDGLHHLEETACFCFEALARLKKEGIPSYLFEEKNRMAELSYQYQSRQNAFQLAYHFAHDLSQEPLASYPRGQLLSSTFHKGRIQKTLTLLSPSTCIVQLLAPSRETSVLPTHKETWMGAEYTVQPIPSDWLALWTQATPHPEIHLPAPNPYLPKELQIAQEEGDLQPTLLCQNDSGIAYYVRSAEFHLPEVIYQLHIASPHLTSDPKGRVLTNLYLEALGHHLIPTLTQAASAQLTGELTHAKGRIHLTIQGFSDKAPLLWTQILRTIAKLPPLSFNQFKLYVDRHRHQYENRQKELAVTQAKDLANSLIDRDRITSQKCLEALLTLSYEEYLSFYQTLLSQSFLEALFAGNLSSEEAATLFATAESYLVKKPFPEARSRKTMPLRFTSLGGPFALAQTTEAQGNAALLLLDQGPFTFETKAVQELLGAILQETFFTELRTKQKTGYMAQSSCLDLGEELYQFFTVQSNSHQPQDLLYRFELFLEDFDQELPFLIPETRFATLQKNQIQLLTHRDRNLQEKSGTWDFLAFEKEGDFHYMQKRIAALEGLSYETFLTYAKQFISRNNRKRLAILYEGKLANPFHYKEISVAELDQIGSYTRNDPKL